MQPSIKVPGGFFATRDAGHRPGIRQFESRKPAIEATQAGFREQTSASLRQGHRSPDRLVQLRVVPLHRLGYLVVRK
jgi:hypothetical protein